MAGAPRVLIVESRYYEKIADELLRGAEAELRRAGAVVERITVPGAFEIPAAVALAHDLGEMGGESGGELGGGPRYDGFVTLGCVIRCETSHYDIICGESARKLQDLACDRGLALGYGILTCENGEQAWARARVDGKDRGGDAARACLAMCQLRRELAIHAQPGAQPGTQPGARSESS